MTARRREQGLGGTDAATLLAGAVDGDTPAFDGLFRRYGPEAWRFAAGVSGVESTARYAVSDGFATSVISARDGHITHPGGFRRSLLHATRVRVAERDDPTSPGHRSSAESIAPAFAALPELLRSTLWLEHVHQLRPNRIGEIAGVHPSDVVSLTRRAHHGVAVHHLGAAAADADAACSAALRSWTRSLVRRLPLRERATVRSHVASCSTCRTALAPVNDLDTYLPPLAAPLPEDLLDETRAAWLIAMTPPTSTGLSPLVEKILAGASAAAAVVAIVGAAYWRTDSPSETVAIAPVLHQVGAPIPTLDGPDINRQLVLSDDEGATSDVNAVSSASASTNTSSTNTSTADASTITATATAPAPSTQALADSTPTVSPDAGDPVEATESETSDDNGTTDTSTDPGTSDDSTTDDTTTAPDPAPDETVESKPLLKVSLPLGPQTLSVNLGDGDLIEVDEGTSALASGSLIDGLTSLLGG